MQPAPVAQLSVSVCSIVFASVYFRDCVFPNMQDAYMTARCVSHTGLPFSWCFVVMLTLSPKRTCREDHTARRVLSGECVEIVCLCVCECIAYAYVCVRIHLCGACVVHQCVNLSMYICACCVYVYVLLTCMIFVRQDRACIFFCTRTYACDCAYVNDCVTLCRGTLGI